MSAEARPIDIRREAREHYYEIIRGAAIDLWDKWPSGGEQALRARQAYIVIAALLAEEDIDLDDAGQFLPYLQIHYLQATGKMLPFGAKSDTDWQRQISDAGRAFHIKGQRQQWDPNSEELARAILIHDPRVEFFSS